MVSATCSHQSRGREHAALHRFGREVLRQRCELGGDHRGRHRVHCTYSAGVLCRDGDDDAGAEDPELLEGLKVGLDASPTARIGAGDGEHYLHDGTRMAHSLIGTIRDLHRRRGRERKGLALAEGVRLVEEALAAGVRVTGAVVSAALEATPRGAALKRSLEQAKVPLEILDDRELADLADTDHPQGIVAVIEPRVWQLGDIPFGPGAVVLALDAVQDPGNVGTLARTVHALGGAGLVTLPGTADLTNSKVLRGSMGSLFRLPSVHASETDFLTWLRQANGQLIVAAADGTDLRSAPRTRGPAVLLVGNEGAGVGPVLTAAAAARVAIPLRPGAESLNVAVATGIILYEVLRER